MGAPHPVLARGTLSCPGQGGYPFQSWLGVLNPVLACGGIPSCPWQQVYRGVPLPGTGVPPPPPGTRIQPLGKDMGSVEVLWDGDGDIMRWVWGNLPPPLENRR